MCFLSWVDAKKSVRFKDRDPVLLKMILPIICKLDVHANCMNKTVHCLYVWKCFSLFPTGVRMGPAAGGGKPVCEYMVLVTRWWSSKDELLFA